LRLSFDAAAVARVLPDGVNLPVRLTGRTRSGTSFTALGTASVVAPSRSSPLTLPAQGLDNGSTVKLQWQGTEAGAAGACGYLSLDGGGSWTSIFTQPATAGVYEWTVNAPATEEARVLIQIESAEGILHQFLSEPIEIRGTAQRAASTSLPTAFLGVSPNPTQGTARLRYSLADASEVRLDIFDVTGRLVRRFAPGMQSAGAHSLLWDGRDLEGRKVPSGVYLYVFQGPGARARGRLMLLD